VRRLRRCAPPRAHIKRIRGRFRIREITIVADRGTVSQATLEAFDNSDPPVRYIVGVRMRRQKEISLSVLGSRARWFESIPERSNTLQQVEANFQGRRFLLRSQLSADASQAVRATGVAIPPTLRELQ
jgi:hypothetical protein